MVSNMQVAAKIFFVAFWVSFFTLAKNQDCQTKNISYENVQTIDQPENHTNGETVKLKCATGYVGLLKLECQNGLWKKIAGRDCKKRPCGHPGDTPNGHFKLVRETEFVFGATVEYTCRTGYTMASRINYRNCRSQGWDNDVPVCEVVKCPIISNLGDVIATGNIEEASYNDIIHFECASNKMLDGPENIHCTDNGQWSGTIPKCKEITCEYPNEEQLSYIQPFNMGVYKFKQNIQYGCKEGYQGKANSATCTENGWEPKPLCIEITCEYPSEEQLSYIQPFNMRVYKFKQNIQYGCKEGYQGKANSATCTENGWEPKPLCIVKKTTCAEPSVQNGFIHKLDEGFSYSCDSGYKAFDEKWWGVVSCTGGQWSYSPLCIAEDYCGQIPNGLEKQNQAKEGYKEGEMKVFECESKPCCFKCIRGKWEKQDCESTKCGSPPPVENAVITNYQETVEYACRENYIINGEHFISCINSQWEKPPTCELQAICAEPSVQNGFIHKLDEGFSYSCDSGYKAFDEKWWGVVSCTGGQWSYTPLCIAEDHCGQIPNGLAKQNQANEGYKEGEMKVFECESKPCCFKCIRGKWEKQDCESTICGSPPPVENAVITEYQETVQYACRENYIIKGEHLISCINSQWEKPPTCE
ncbi:complement factor H-like isoform X2 [Hemibagrus wyckioides]|nr:complement factor H-like isoform X2 [Hemibagrus wyckioides]